MYYIEYQFYDMYHITEWVVQASNLMANTKQTDSFD